MKQLKVLRSHCGINGINEYIIVDIEEQTQVKVKASYEGLKDLLIDSGFVGISPMEYRGYMNYKQCTLSDLILLPF